VVHREPILSALGAGPPAPDSDKAGIQLTDNDRTSSSATTTMKNAFSCPQQKPVVQWPGSSKGTTTVTTSSLFESVVEQATTAERKQQQSSIVEVKPRSAPGRYLTVLEIA